MNIFIIVLVVLIDQISKLIVGNILGLNESVKIIDNFFYITNVNNYGAAFNIFNGNTIFLILIALIMLYMLYKYFKDNNINILVGGIIGNLIDRIIYGYVRDFLDFRIFGYNYPIFNISDICICIGIFILIIKELKQNGSK